MNASCGHWLDPRPYSHTQVSRWPRWQQRRAGRGGGLRGVLGLRLPRILGWQGWQRGRLPLGESAGGGSASALTSAAPEEGGQEAGAAGAAQALPPRCSAGCCRQARAGLCPPSTLAPLRGQGGREGPTRGRRYISRAAGLAGSGWRRHIPRSGASRSPSETGTSQGTQAMHCAEGLAGGLKITRCECLEGLGPWPWPHTIGGNSPASSIVWLQTLASSVLPRGHGSRQHKGAVGCQGGLLGRW